MNAIVRYFAKKYLLKAVNDGLKAAQEKADIKKYVQKIAEVIRFLSVLVEVIKDSEITTEEVEKITEEFNSLFQGEETK